MLAGDITRPILALAEDAQRAENAMDADSNGYARRNYVRAIFAMVEDTIYVIKQIVLEINSQRGGILSVAELALLEESIFDLDNRGEPKTVTKYLKVPENLRFTARCYSKVVGRVLQLPVGQKGWEELKRAIAIRNRITHPKSVLDIDVSQDEEEVVRRVSHWFNDVIAAAVDGVMPPKSGRSMSQ